MEHQLKPLLLIFPFGLLSHYLRCIVLARHLKSSFEIKFASSSKYDHFVIAEGFTTFNCISLDEDEVMAKIRKFDFSWLKEEDLKETFLGQVAAIEHYKAAVVLGDAVATLKMAAEFTGTYHISLINGYMSNYYAETRTLSTTHPIYPLLRKLPQIVVNILTAEGEALAFKKIHKPFKTIRRLYDLKEIKDYLIEMEGDLTLICDLQQLFPQRCLPDNYRMTGPLIYGAPVNTDHTSENNNYREKKTIYVSMGSTGEWKNVCFLNDIEYAEYNIITAGDKEEVLNAHHIHGADFIPTEEVLPHADLVICHGGNGTIYQALAYGVPVLCFPSHFEQEWNSKAIEKQGLGRLITDDMSKTGFHPVIKEWIGKKNQDSFIRFKKYTTETTSALEAVNKYIRMQCVGEEITSQSAIES